MNVFFSLLWTFSMLAVPVCMLILIINAIRKKTLQKTALITFGFTAIASTIILSTAPNDLQSSVDALLGMACLFSLISLFMCLVLLAIKAIQRQPLKRVRDATLSFTAVLVLIFVIVGATAPPLTPEQIVERETMAVVREQEKEDKKAEKEELERILEQENVKSDELDEREKELGEKKVVEPTPEPISEPQSDAPIIEPSEYTWSSVFTPHGFTDEQALEYGEILETVGIYELSVIDYSDDYNMGVMRARIYGNETLQLNIIFEDGKIIVITLAGIPATESQFYIGWSGKLKSKTVDNKKSIDLYYDIEGGYIAVLDWETMTIEPYELS